MRTEEIKGVSAKVVQNAEIVVTTEGEILKNRSRAAILVVDAETKKPVKFSLNQMKQTLIQQGVGFRPEDFQMESE